MLTTTVINKETKTVESTHPLVKQYKDNLHIFPVFHLLEINKAWYINVPVCAASVFTKEV